MLLRKQGVTDVTLVVDISHIQANIMNEKLSLFVQLIRSHARIVEPILISYGIEIDEILDSVVYFFGIKLEREHRGEERSCERN